MSKLIVAGAAAIALMAGIGIAASGGGDGGRGGSGLSQRRQEIDGILASVVPCQWPDERFKRMDPIWTPDAEYTTCISLVHYVGLRMGLKYGINSGGCEATRTNAKKFGAWVKAGSGAYPKHGDVLCWEYIDVADPIIIHVGFFLETLDGGGRWRTADGGQGGREAQGANFVVREFNRATWRTKGISGWRKVAGWVDLDRVPQANAKSLVPETEPVADKPPWEGLH